MRDTILIVIKLLANVFVTIFILRWLLQLFGLSYFNALYQSLYQITQPVVQWLGKIIPRKRRWDLPLLITTVLLAWFFQSIEVIWVGAPWIWWLTFGFAIVSLLKSISTLLFIAVIGRALLSWSAKDVQPHPIYEVVFCLTEPMCKPLRNCLPDFSGIDFSPLVVLLLIKLFDIIVIDWVQGFLVSLW